MTDNQQLVPVFTGELQNKTVQLCNARDLHSFLGVGKVFAAWITERVEAYGFLAGTDFEVFSEIGKNPNGGRPSKDYHITLNMAKELAMVENNDKGKQVRRYFIAMEEKAREMTSRRLPPISQQLSAHNTRLKLLDKMELERHPEKRLAIHQQLDHVSRILGLPTPALEAIGYAVAPEPVPSMVLDFWEMVEFIGLDKLNHSRDAQLIAINLNHFVRLATEHRLKAPSTLDLRRVLERSVEPKFLGPNKTVNSRIEQRAVKCWMFASGQP